MYGGRVTVWVGGIGLGSQVIRVAIGVLNTASHRRDLARLGSPHKLALAIFLFQFFTKIACSLSYDELARVSCSKFAAWLPSRVSRVGD